MESKIDDLIISAPSLFSENKEITISFSQFKYLIENFSNKATNIHLLSEEINIAIPTLLKTVEIVRPMINDRSTKIKLTKLLFQIFGMISLNISKAYDTTWRHRIIIILSKILTNGTMFKYITNFYKKESLDENIQHFIQYLLSRKWYSLGSSLTVTLILFRYQRHCKNNKSSRKSQSICR